MSQHTSITSGGSRGELHVVMAFHATPERTQRLTPSVSGFELEVHGWKRSPGLPGALSATVGMRPSGTWWGLVDNSRTGTPEYSRSTLSEFARRFRDAVRVARSDGGEWTVRRARLLLVAAVALVMLVGLIGCLGKLLTPPSTATLIVSEAMISDGRGRVMLSVKDMPDGGMAAIAVVVGGVGYLGHISNVAIEGLQGFEVLASLFDDGTGDGGFVLSNPSVGIVDGEFARITFDTTGPVTAGDIVFSAGDISMSDDSGALIPVFDLDQLAHQYYVK